MNDEQLFFTSGSPVIGRSFRVKIKDGDTVLADKRVMAEESGWAADIVLDELALPHDVELRVEVLVTD